MSAPVATLAAAFAAFSGGRLQEAATLCEALLALRSDDVDAWHLSGVVLQALGRREEAAAALNRAAALAPQDAQVRRNQGAVLAGLARFAEAIPALEAAHELAPEDATALENLISALQEIGEAAKAAALLEPWLARHPAEARLWYRLGMLLAELRRTPEAIDALRRVLALRPGDVKATRALAQLRFNRFEFAAAAACYRSLIGTDPADADAHRKLADVLSIQCELEASEAQYRRAQSLKPDTGLDFVIATQLPAILPSATAIDALRARYETRLDDILRRKPALEDPALQVGHTNQFYLAYHGRDDRALQEKLAQAYLASCPALGWRAPYIDSWHPRERLRIGVVSTHLGAHTVGYVTQGLLERLDKKRFEVVLFHPRRRDDETAEAVAASTAGTIDIPSRLAEARTRIAEAKLDLLYFPDIGMAPITYFLAFARLAPVQCIGWGHPDTTGIPNADYWISAADWEPAQGDRHYSERLVRLRVPPVFYAKPASSPSVRTRADFGLPAHGSIYLAPMSLFKFHPDFDPLIVRILDEDSEAHLVLAAGHAAEWDALLRSRIASSSPDAAKRLIFLPRMSFADFQSLAQLGDAFLDPIYFGGGRTSLDLFAQGVPIVNWPGPFMRSRITYGFYRQMGMTDLVAEDHDGYVALALRLARDRDWREAMGRQVSERSAALYENDAAVGELEAFFAAAVDAAAAGGRLDRWPLTFP